MISSRQNKSGRRRLIITLVVLAVLVAGLWGLTDKTPITGLETMASGAAYPLLKFKNLIGSTFYSAIDFFHTRAVLVAENKKLQNELTRAQIELLNLTSLEADNVALRETLGRASGESLPLAARIISRQYQSTDDTLIIDLGQDNTNREIKIGDLVTIEGTVALGRIAELHSQTAKVRLFSSPQEVISGQIGTSVILTLAGRGGGNFSGNAPRGLEIEIGTPVTVGLLGREFLIGLVGEIKNLASDPYQEILIRLPANLAQIKWVEIDSL